MLVLLATYYFFLYAERLIWPLAVLGIEEYFRLAPAGKTRGVFPALCIVLLGVFSWWIYSLRINGNLHSMKELVCGAASILVFLLRNFRARVLQAPAQSKMARFRRALAGVALLGLIGTVLFFANLRPCLFVLECRLCDDGGCEQAICPEKQSTSERYIQAHFFPAFENREIGATNLEY